MNEATLTEHKYQWLTLWIVYCLYLLTIPSILGVFINWLEVRKSEQLEKEHKWEDDKTLQLLDSHHRWLLRTFIFCFVLSLAAIGTSYYGVGYLVGAATILWWFFRVVKGMVMLSANRPMPG